ncbi:MAG TPA: pilin [Candidatus Saccharimonadales bacterium]|nr:pilin [Candidatus Saccharimonadales bacterium]
MIKKLKTFITVAVAGLLLTAPGAVPAFASTAFASTITDNLCTGVNNAANNTTGTDCGTAGTSGSSTIQTVASTAVNIFSIIVGIVAVIMIIYGGFRYITSGGASENVSNAKNTIIYAIIGLIVVAIAQVIVHFVINTATGATNTNT